MGLRVQAGRGKAGPLPPRLHHIVVHVIGLIVGLIVGLHRGCLALLMAEMMLLLTAQMMLPLIPWLSSSCPTAKIKHLWPDSNRQSLDDSSRALLNNSKSSALSIRPQRQKTISLGLRERIIMPCDIDGGLQGGGWAAPGPCLQCQCLQVFCN